MTWSLLKMNASFSFIPVNVIASRRKNSVVCVRWACSVCVCKPRAQFEYLCICVFSFYPLCVHIVFLSFSHCHNHIKTHEKKMNTNSEIQTWTINFYFSRQFFFVVLLFLLSCRISLSLHFLTMHCHCCHLICCFIAESVKFWWSSMENVKKKKNLKKKPWQLQQISRTIIRSMSVASGKHKSEYHEGEQNLKKHTTRLMRHLKCNWSNTG